MTIHRTFPVVGLAVLDATTDFEVSDADWINLSVDITDTAGAVGTITFQGSVDGTTFYTLSLLKSLTTSLDTYVTTSTTFGIFTREVSGLKTLRAKATSYSSGTIQVFAFTGRF